VRPDEPHPMNSPFSHLEGGEARMVSVAHKPEQLRIAEARCRLLCQPATLEALREHALPKGDVLAVARVAGIQAAKSTSSLIPLCHPLPLDQVLVDFVPGADGIEVACTVRTGAKTGVEMEALTGASVAALALYDMLKSADKTLSVQDLRVVRKEKL
jgi:cyclic pyranopterin phosphate synthase